MRNDWIVEQYVRENLISKIEQEYYLDDKGNFVFTEHYLKKMSSCCGNGCKHCPFEPRHSKGNSKLVDIYRK